MEDVNNGDSAALQIGGQALVHTKNYPYNGEVEIITLSLPKFEPWTLVQTLQPQNQLCYAHTGTTTTIIIIA